MILNGVQYYRGMGDSRRVPLLAVGDKITLLYDDETPLLAGGKRVRKGTYTVIKVRPSLCSVFVKGDSSLVYDLRKNGAKYTHGFDHVSIDKALEAGVIKRA